MRISKRGTNGCGSTRAQNLAWKLATGPVAERGFPLVVARAPMARR